MDSPLRVLIVEDSADDAQLILDALRRGEYEPAYARVDTAEGMRTTLHGSPWDIVLADYAMPHFSGPAALELVLQSRLDIPFIIVSGKVGEQQAIDMMRAGACDFIFKNNLTRLVPAVRRELREAQIRREHRQAIETLREREAHYRLVTETATDAIITINQEGTILSVNPAVQTVFGYSPEELPGRPLSLLIPPKLREEQAGALKEYLQTGIPHFSWQSVELSGLRRDGRSVPLEISFGEFQRDDAHIFVGIARDVTERKHAEEALQRERAFLSSAIDLLPFPISFDASTGEVIRANRACAHFFSDTEAANWDKLTFLTTDTHTPVPPTQLPATRSAHGEVVSAFEAILVCAGGRKVNVSYLTRVRHFTH